MNLKFLIPNILLLIEWLVRGANVWRTEYEGAVFEIGEENLPFIEAQEDARQAMVARAYEADF